MRKNRATSLSASLLLAFSAAFTGLTAQAEVKLPGRVLASQCAPAQEINPPMGGFTFVEICQGRVVGSDKDYLIVTESRVVSRGAKTQITLWEIGAKATDGKSVQLIEAGRQNNKGYFEEKAALNFTTGTMSATDAICGRAYDGMTGELDGRRFTTGKFEIMMHTM